MTIPLNIEGRTKNCVIELRDLSGNRLIAPIFRGPCSPGIHNIVFDPHNVSGELEAGIYMIRIEIDGDSKLYPIQYMP